MKTLKKQLTKILLACSLVWGVPAIAEVEMLDENATKQQIRDAFFNKGNQEVKTRGINLSPETEEVNEDVSEEYQTRGIEGFSTEEQKLKVPSRARVKKVKPAKKKYAKRPPKKASKKVYKKPQKKYTKKTYRKKYPPKPQAQNKQRYDAGVATAIQFKYNSDELLSGSRTFIKNFGDVLAETDVKFIIEGHTDASGAENHNYQLSKQRADKIKRIFVTEHNIAENRIITIGKGETSLRFSANNYKNRRVEIKPMQ